MLDRTGQTLGQYRILASIGSGGFADVYLGEHVFLKTQAAIKVLHTQITSGMNEQFLAEARTIAHLVHPHIVRVHDFGIENATPFLVMDYAPNGTLRQRHPRGIAVPLALVVPYVKQIAGALQFAHDHHLIHRDVKPENMLLGARNEVLLSDFGIATISQTSRSLSTQDVSGTIAYMGPEQVQGKPRPASDQYSLAVITYEWLTGQTPFRGSFAEIASQHMFAPPPSLRALNSSISREVEEVLMTALAKNPDARFARIEAFANALEQASRAPIVVNPSDAPTYISAPNQVVRTATPIPAPYYVPVSPLESNGTAPEVPQTAAVFYPGVIGQLATQPPQPASQPPQKEAGMSRRGLLIGAGAVVALLAAGEGAWLLISRNSTGTQGISTPTVSPNTPTTGTTATTSTPSPQPDPDPTSPPPVIVTPLVHSAQNAEFTAAWSPDGTLIASGGASSTIEVWDAHNNSGHFTMNVSPASKVFRVAWSHRGDKIASADEKGNIIIWNASGNQITSFAAHPNHFANCVAWSPDDSMLATAGGDNTAAVWDQNGNNITTYSQHTSPVNAVAWSHSGTYVASASDDGTAQVWYASNGQHFQTYSGHTSMVLALAWSLDDTRIATCSDDTTAQVWDVASGSTSLRYTGHRDFVVALDWSPDGQKIVTGSKDTTAQVWNANDGHPIYTFPDHRAEVEGVAWASDSQRVASAADDNTVQVWKLP